MYPILVFLLRMQLKILAITLWAVSISAGDEIEADDVPAACLSFCQVTLCLTQRCERETSLNYAFRECVCAAPQAQGHMVECATCVEQNNDE